MTGLHIHDKKEFGSELQGSQSENKVKKASKKVLYSVTECLFTWIYVLFLGVEEQGSWI